MPMPFFKGKNTTDHVVMAMEDAGHKHPQLTLRYAEYWGLNKDGSRLHAVLLWDQAKGKYEAGVVKVYFKNNHYHADFVQGGQDAVEIVAEM